jgi:hypothetical protein
MVRAPEGEWRVRGSPLAGRARKKRAVVKRAVVKRAERLKG